MTYHCSKQTASEKEKVMTTWLPITQAFSANQSFTINIPREKMQRVATLSASQAEA